MADITSRAPRRASPTIPSRKSSGDSEKEGFASAPPNVKPRKSTYVDRVRQQYKYSKLAEGHARLLVLHPKEDENDRIDVTLTDVLFDDLGKDSRGTNRGSQDAGTEYEALSYHWNYEYKNDDTLKAIHIRDDPNRMLARQAPTSDAAPATAAPAKHIKHVVDSLTSKTMFVKPNLHHALRRLRLKTTPVTLWVDALCINQEDQVEKQHQVSRMKDIYSRATSVAIWLGESDDRTKSAIPFVKEVINLPTLNALVTDETRVNDWRNLIHLMRRSWFSRRWVIQELALASNATVHCGSDTVHWNDFRDAISIFSHEFERVRRLFKRSEEYDHDFYAIGDLAPLGAKVLVDAINNIFRKKNRGTLYQPMQSLEYLVSTLSAFGSSDPRDTIHALNNIAKETSRVREARESSPVLEPPQPDYNKTLLQVYTEYVLWVVRTTRSIDIICRRWAIPERSRQDVKQDINYPKYSALPSWIQQISSTPSGRQNKAANGRVHGDTFVGLPGRKSYDACNSREANISFGPDGQFPDQDDASYTPQTEKQQQEGIPFTELHEPEDQAVLGAIDPNRKSKTPGTNKTTSSAGTGDVSTAPGSRKRPYQDEASDSANVRHKRSRTDGKSDGSRKSAKIAQNGGRGNDDDDSDSDKSTSSSVSSASSDFDLAEDRVLKQLVEEGRDASLHVKGLLIGTVSDCTEPIADGVIPEKAVRKLRRASKNDADLMWRTLVGERGDHGENPPAWYQRACQECVVSHTSNGHINTKDLYQKSTHPDHVRKYLQRVQAVTWDRSFLEIRGPTSGDKMHGFGPGKTRKGDLVCILFGCSVPCVLRRRHDDDVGTYYLFIGEAYVYGIMDGEAVSSLTEEEIEARQESFRML